MRRYSGSLLSALTLWPLMLAAQVADVPSTHSDEFIQSRGFMVVADRRVFAVMAFLNAVGYDEEAENKQMSPTRVKAREAIAANLVRHQEKVEQWRRAYARWGLAIFHYEDFALSLSPDFPFSRMRSDNELSYPSTAKRLRDFPEILNDFWQVAKLESVWETVKPEYITELRKYDIAKMNSDLAFTWEYLRMPRKDTLTLVNVPNLLDKHYHAIGAQYGRYYLSVESPGAIGYSVNIHEYLHSVINDLMAANYDKQRKKLDKYFAGGKNGPMSRSYGSPVTFAYECLVRALDGRIAVKLTADAARRSRVEKRIANETDKGLKLTGPFYALLSEYEQSKLPFDQFLPTMLEKLLEYRPGFDSH